ncbi:MAG: PaaI family thioesterase [Pseudomonadota bacterium]|jgi:uncharacterized protein (TIGR00369 family)|nr:thioesterase [Rhodobacterales bacterium]MEE2621661.1 PaaI family thioesterase [Pseudomonadota bacterium]|tara:strand:- start:3043 stop:3459 length:417 start_codon:yes stop_codon:yes gene_type:complete
MKNQISIKEISKKLKDIFPQVADKYEIISLKSNYSEVKLLSNNKNLRPGNTISGPSMFELADLSFYIAIMASTDLGDKSVTTNVSINFIKKPLLSNLLGISQIKKMGKRLVVGDVEILSEDKKQIYAQALFTYSIPRN